VVLLGLGLVWLSYRLGPEWAWLQKADAVAALVVSLLVLRVSLQLGWRAVGELLDTAPPGLTDLVIAEVQAVPGVQSVGPVRVRQAGADTFVDLTVEVDRSASLEESHQVATDVERQLSAMLPSGDVVVHVDPVRQSNESLPQTVGAIAGRLGLRTHNVHAHEIQGRYFVDLHVEVPPELTLAEAHEQVAGLEAALREELPYVEDIHSHIEPDSVPVAPAAQRPGEDERLRAEIAAVVEGVPGLHTCHNIYLRPGRSGYDVVLHCLADPDLPVIEAHHLADQAERKVLAQVPGIGQVLVHVEPTRRGRLDGQ
jgi:divalent metal cation (Fe/Co/Zn/Cd) transporter